MLRNYGLILAHYVVGCISCPNRLAWHLTTQQNRQGGLDHSIQRKLLFNSQHSCGVFSPFTINFANMRSSDVSISSSTIFIRFATAVQFSSLQLAELEK